MTLCLRSSSRRRNTSASVTVTVTVTVAQWLEHWSMTGELSLTYVVTCS